MLSRRVDINYLEQSMTPERGSPLLPRMLQSIYSTLTILYELIYATLYMYEIYAL